MGTEKNNKEKCRLLQASLATATSLGVLLNGIFDTPKDLTSPKEATFPPVQDVAYKPVEHTDYVLVPDDDDNDDSDSEKKKLFSGVLNRLRGQILKLPTSVRTLIGLPLWCLGWVVNTSLGLAWSNIGSPILAALLRMLCLMLVILVTLILVLKLLFPNLSLKDLLSKKTLLAVFILALACEGMDLAGPRIWEHYTLYSRIVRFSLSLLLIGLTVYKVKKRIPQDKV